MNNKKLFYIVVFMVPFVVISFFFKKEETNFNLEEKTEKEEKIENEYVEPTIKLLTKGKVVELKLEDYIVGVVAGEMPASFNMEALKAQAVASRSFALYKKNSSNGLYDLTDDINSQVYISIDDMKAKWNGQFQKYYDRIKDTVAATKGEVITYDGDIIEAFYFSMSSGSTQDARFVFNEDRDYLKGVTSEYDNGTLNNYEVTKEMSKEDFIKNLDLSCNNITIDNINYNESGYIENITICSKKMKGQDFRMALGLRSANVKISITDKVTMTTKGYGHGVGMSQYGANGYAEAGYTYEDIIKHYYTGVEITDLKSV